MNAKRVKSMQLAFGYIHTTSYFFMYIRNISTTAILEVDVAGSL